MRTALWQIVKKAHPNLTDHQVNQLLQHGLDRAGVIGRMQIERVSIGVAGLLSRQLGRS